MGTLTISVDDETERRFRHSVQKRYGVGKGKLGRAVADALRAWNERAQKQESRAKLMKILEEGVGVQMKGASLRREEMYAKRL